MTEQSLPILFRHRLAAPLLLSLLTLLVYVNSFPGAFIQDDLHIVKNNPLLHSPDLITIFTSDYWHGYQNTGLYRPLTILSLALNRMLLGEAPWGYHLVNVLLHAGATLLFWRLLLRWNVVANVALLAAALFAVHPIHTEVLNEVVGRSELLVAVFLLVAFLAVGSHEGKSVVAVCGCYLCALLSKEHAITFPALLLLAEGFRGRSLIVELRNRWRLYAALSVTAILWLVWRQFGLVQSLPPVVISVESVPLAYVDGSVRIASALSMQWLYLAKMFWPFGLQAVYSSADLSLFLAPLFSVTGGLTLGGSLLALVALFVGWRRGHRLSLYAALYVVSFLPASNIIFPIGVTMAERLAYFPSLWFCAGLAVAFGSPWPSSALRRTCLILAMLYLLLLSSWCVLRNRDFSSEVSLWSAEVENNSADFLGWQSLAESLANSGDLAGADVVYQELLRKQPEFHGGLRSYTAFFLIQSRYREALPLAERALRVAQSRNVVDEVVGDRLLLAQISVELAQYAEALRYLDEGELPVDSIVHAELLGRSLAGLGRHVEAVNVYSQVAAGPVGIDFLYHYAKSLFNIGRLSEARSALERFVGERNSAEAWNLLGVVCAQQSDWPAARSAFSRAVERMPDNRYYRENLQRAMDLSTGVDPPREGTSE